MRLIPIYLACIFFCLETNSQTIKTAHWCDSLLQVGNFKAVITTYEFPDAIKSLQKKAIDNLKKNPEWADKYIVRMVERGDRELEFNNAMGLTKDEFRIMHAGFEKGQHPVYSDTSGITIKKEKGIISFKASKKMELLNFLSIDTKSTIVYFDNFKAVKERDFIGNIFAPTLKGVQAYSTSEVNGVKHQTTATSFGLVIGVNKNETKSTICLGYTPPTKSTELQQPKFLIVTIL